ncbi:GNAT family N-acetyltransferase [Ureibacillus thermosphaericus]|uniref:GNAT family N-acetyltransferase n=1 Tax=Ureibacillus thermosphaericus TaxID=51173 RepID=UPI000BBBFF2E|nr:GNAT family N-acetyltransferase [Ureibacillus thermosphaericus]
MIRPMTMEDLDSVLEIYNDAILNTTALYRTEPETLEGKQRWFLEIEKENNPMFVYEEDGEVVGFAAFKRFVSNEGYKYSMEHSVYVSAKHRGKGIGKKLLQKLIEEAKKREVRTLIALIDSDNIASIKLHEQFGFHFAGRLQHVGYKFGKWLDIVYYQLELYE